MKKRIVVFAYNFPHKKTQEGLFALISHNLKPDFIIAQDMKTLPPNPDSLGIVPKDATYLIHPREIARTHGISYLNADHDSETAHIALLCGEFDLGIILGARILHKTTIQCIKNGMVINMHPGLLPDNRGLDNLKRAILNDLPPVVSIHKINERIDAGVLYEAYRVPVYRHDTFHSIFLRHQALEIRGMIDVVTRFKDNMLEGMELPDTSPYPSKLGDSCDAQILDRFWDWKLKYETP